MATPEDIVRQRQQTAAQERVATAARRKSELLPAVQALCRNLLQELSILEWPEAELINVRDREGAPEREIAAVRLRSSGDGYSLGSDGQPYAPSNSNYYYYGDLGPEGITVWDMIHPQRASEITLGGLHGALERKLEELRQK